MAELTVNIEKIAKNYSIINNICTQHNKTLFPVTKCIRSDKIVIEKLSEIGLETVTDVHAENLSVFKGNIKTALLSSGRSIINSEFIPDILYTSDPFIINSLSKKNDKVSFIIQLEMGGLREGITEDYQDTFISLLEVSSLKRIIGFSTNYGCIHGIIPDRSDLNTFCTTALQFAEKIGLDKPVIAAGGTILFNSLIFNMLPKELTHIRMGESVLFGFNTYTDKPIGGLESDIFTLYGEVLEIKTVNTEIKGISQLNSFGVPFDNSLKFMNNGIRKRAVVDFGIMTANKKFIESKLSGAYICAQSYEHSIIDITDCDLNIENGIKIPFSCKYDAVAKSYHNPFIKIIPETFAEN